MISFMHPKPSTFRPEQGCACRHAGVTLVELIVVITITGIIAVVLGKFIVQPIQGFTDMTRRAELVDAAEMAMRQTARDIRQALPNSVRIDASGRVLEILSTLDGARYRQRPGTATGGHPHPPANPEFRLQVPGNDANGFNIVGFFQNITVPFSSTNVPADCPYQCRLAIYNQGNVAADAYADGDESTPVPANYVITRPGQTTFTIADDGGGDEHQVLPGGGQSFRFRHDSDTNRVFIVSTPVTYICDTAAGTITRYSNYPIRTTQPTDPAIAPLSGAQRAVLAQPVTACTFRYTPGTSTRFGIVSLDITVRDAQSGEQVRLLHQVHVDNSP
jgi:MSHA biogenesis protein MshO